MIAASAAQRCAQLAEQARGDPQSLALLVAAGLAVLLLIGRWARRKRASRYSPDHPLLREAIRKARSTLPTLAMLHAAGAGKSLVRLQLPLGLAIDDWPWAELVELGPALCVLALPRSAPGHESEPLVQLTVPIENLGDWLVELPDGSLRGGFTTQAELRLARQSGARRSPTINYADRRFIDS